MDTPFRIHQALHGYFDGHRLLSSSRPLPQEAERQLLILSDLSGPGFIEGFDAYLTGYPLRSVNLFAFARTWYAPEMERPGCVFTHSLLVEFADLATLPTLHMLLPLFRRPKAHSSFRHYQAPLAVPQASILGALPDSQVCRALLDGLYANPDRPVVVGTDQARRWEELTLRLWSQQWPRLRRSFSFCTGSLGPRFLGRSPFDLLFVPHTQLRQVRREFSRVYVLDPAVAIEPRAWIDALECDLAQEPDSALRNFLWSFGADADPPRVAMAPLIEAFLSRTNPDRSVISHLALRIATAFPQPQLAAQLKNALFGGSSPLPEESVLLALFETLATGAYDVGTFQVTERAVQLYQQDPKAALDLLAVLLRHIAQNMSISDVRYATIRQLTDVLSVDELAQLRQQRDLIHPLLVVAPQRFLHELVWQKSDEDELRGLLNTAHSVRGSHIVSLVTSLLLSLEAYCLAPEYLEFFGAAGTAELLLQLDQLNRQTDDDWHDALARRPDLLLQWLETEPATPPAGITWALGILGTTSSLSLPAELEAFGRNSVSKLRDRSHDLALAMLVWLLDRTRNSFGQVLLEGLADISHPEDIDRLREHAPSSLPLLVQLNPRLAELPNFWTGSLDEQRTVLQALSQVEKLSTETMLAIARHILPRPTLAETFIQTFAVKGVAAVLSLAQEAEGEFDPGPVWPRALQGVARLVVQWLQQEPAPSPALLAWLAGTLSPTSSEILDVDTVFWEELWTKCQVGDSQNQVVTIAAFFFTVALLSKKPDACRLARATFASVHEAAACNNLPSNAWQRLDLLLPRLGLFGDWDRCERIRRGFASRFVRRDWPVSELFAALTNDRLVWSVVSSCKEVKGGRRFVSEIRGEVERGRCAIPFWQRTVLRWD